MTGYRTYVSIIVAVLPSILGLFGYQLVEGQTEEMTNLLNDAWVVVAGLAAFYYRAKAETPGFLQKKV